MNAMQQRDLRPCLVIGWRSSLGALVVAAALVAMSAACAGQMSGPASSPDGLNSLTTWAQTLPRSSDLVIYCGCCALRDCPNLRPAYTALTDLGFSRVRMLILPDRFRSARVDRGFPVEK